MRNEVVVDVQVVWKSMQQHESWTTAWKVSDIKASASVRNPMLGESWKGRALRGSGAFCGNAHDSSLQFLGLRGGQFAFEFSSGILSTLPETSARPAAEPL